MNVEKPDKNKISELYGRLEGITDYLERMPHTPRKEVADNYTKILDQLSELSGTGLEDFRIPQGAFYPSGGDFYCSRDVFEPKIIELVHYLRKRYSFLERGVQPLDVQVYLSIRGRIGLLFDFLKAKIPK